jgi:hypothetical protein
LSVGGSTNYGSGAMRVYFCRVPSPP